MSRPAFPLRQSLAMLLVAAALLLRAAVPQGWMTREDAGGGITLTLCNSAATVTIPMREGHQPRQQHEDDGEGAAKACAFAGLHAAATPPQDPAELPLPQVAAAAYDALRQQATSPQQPAFLPPATGPPVRA